MCSLHLHIQSIYDTRICSSPKQISLLWHNSLLLVHFFLVIVVSLQRLTNNKWFQIVRCNFSLKPILNITGKVIQQSLENRAAVLTTSEGSAKDDDSYLGYSMAAGDFYNEGEQGVAVGMPRGHRLLGKVIYFLPTLFKFELKLILGHFI